MIEDGGAAHFNTIKKKTKIKSKIQPSVKKTHTKGNNSVYMKGFDKLMKERYSIERKSVKRMKALRASDEMETIQNAKAALIPQPK